MYDGGISVIIPCHNQGRFLNEAIQSVLSQSYSSAEIIVVNDGSTDDTATAVAEYGSRVTYVEQSHQGPAKARNTGLRHVTKELVHFLDADDYLLPGLYEKIISTFTAERSISCIYFGNRLVSERGELSYVRQARPESTDMFHELLAANCWPIHAVVVRTCELSRVGNFDSRLHVCEDWDLWLRLAMGGCRFVPLAEVGACYRRYPGTLSSDLSLMLEHGMRVITRNAFRHGWCYKCRRSMIRGFWVLQQRYSF